MRTGPRSMPGPRMSTLDVVGLLLGAFIFVSAVALKTSALQVARLTPTDPSAQAATGQEAPAPSDGCKQ
jgi:hypothetical protein